MQASAFPTAYPETQFPSNLAANKPAEGFAVAADVTSGDEAPADSSAEPSTGGSDNAQFHVLFNQAMDRAAVELDLGKLAEVHLALSDWYDHPQLNAAEERQLADLLNRLAGTVIYSHQHHLLEPPYVVRQGDTLDRIAAAHQVPAPLLAKINGIADPASLRPGETLKVVRGPFHARVDLKNHRLTLFVQGRYAGRFAIGVGRDQAAPNGDFEVAGITRDPAYRENRVVAPGDPQNPLGKYWIDLGNRLGIHGTPDPRNVGRSDVPGCICLAESDLEHVVDMLSVGSKVEIRGATPGLARSPVDPRQSYRTQDFPTGTLR
jgi:lipoprotein-anchoring transpeptidase ErfK/SrfK